MREITTTVYMIDEHPDKAKCFEWVRNNVFHLGEHEVDELRLTLDKLSEHIGGTVDYCLSQHPDRGEHITFKDWDEEALNSLVAEECPLTGCFWDMEVITAFKKENLRAVIDTLHDCVEHIYSDEELELIANANEWEFKETGGLL
jgi:hypothetical protein